MGFELFRGLSVNYYGPFGIVGGLGSAARGYLSALRAVGVQVAIVPINEMFVLHPSDESSIGIGQSPRHAISLVSANADSVPRFLHFRGRSFARSRYKIGLWVWELPALRDEWRGEVRHFDEIWVPSAFCQRAVKSVTEKPVTVAPHVVEPPEAVAAGMRGRLKIADDAFVFLYMFDAASFVERKNPLCLVDAFQSAFPQERGVRLVLKVSNADRNPEFDAYLNGLETRDPRCVIVRHPMSASEVAGLLAASNCYVSPHRSEGFGLTIAEAMIQGVPVIATAYSGAADFVSDDVGYPLRYKLTEIDSGAGPYPAGAIWAEPSVEHLQELLREVVVNPTATARKAQKARARILEAYSVEAVGGIMARRLQEIAAG